MAKTWSEVMHPTVQRLEVATAIKAEATWNPTGSKALAILIADMAEKLDRAVEAVEPLRQAKVALEFMAAEDDETGKMARHPLRMVRTALDMMGG